jgi:hypothetical protein
MSDHSAGECSVRVRVIRPRWTITDKGDQDVRALADGHYSRQTPGSRQFCRNGQNLVFVTADNTAAWVTFRPTPGKAKRQDNLDAWECSLFRNTGPILSSDLVAEAVALSIALWGDPPRDGVITYVKPEAIRSVNPGYCFKRAGWVTAGKARDGKPMLRAPIPDLVPHWSFWSWKGERGGKLRRELEAA